MNNKLKVKCFTDIRDVVFGLSDEEWRAVNRDLSYKYTKLELVILCSSIVKILSTHVIECILPALIDAVGILPVLRADIKLRGKSAQGRTTSQRSPEDPSDYVCNIIEGIVTQIKEAMKQTLMKFSSVKIQSKSKSVKRNVDPVGETASDCSLIDGLTASSTNGIIAEIIRLCCPDISHKITKGKEPDQPVSFREVINSIVKAMGHMDNVRRCHSTRDVLGESDDERSAVSDGGEENMFSEQIRSKAVHTISDILLEAGEKIASAGSPHSNHASSAGPLDEIMIMASSIRVRPTASEITKTILKDLKKPASSDGTTSDSAKPVFSRNRFLSAACKTYRCVQKKVFLFLLKAQASASPEEEPRATSGESETLESGNSDATSSELSSEHVSPSMTNAVKGSSTSVCDKEQVSLDMCTDEVISKILGVYRKQARKLTSDHFQSTCTQLVRDVLVKKVLHTGKNPRKIARSRSSDVPLRKLSRDLITYLDSAASEMTRSVSRDLEECLEALSRNGTQTGSSRVSNQSALDYANVFTPFRLFRHVRNMIKNIFSTVNEAKQSNISVGTTSGYDETSFEPVTEILIREDGTIVKKSSSDHDGFSRGFAQRQSRIANSAINQLKSVLSSDSTTQHHALVITNAISTILRNMIEAPNIGRKFSESVLMEAFSHSRVFGARGISPLVHSFVLEFMKHLVHYLSSTESAFLQMAVQTEFLTFREGALRTDPEKAITVALSELRKSLTYFVVKSTDTAATPINGMPVTQNTSTLDELNARSHESQFSALDIECSYPSVGRSAGRRRRITIHFTVGKEASWISDPEKSEKSKNGSCPAGQQEIHSSDELNGNNDWLGETAGSCLRRKFAPFSSAVRKLFKSC